MHLNPPASSSLRDAKSRRSLRDLMRVVQPEWSSSGVRRRYCFEVVRPSMDHLFLLPSEPVKQMMMPSRVADLVAGSVGRWSFMDRLGKAGNGAHIVSLWFLHEVEVLFNIRTLTTRQTSCSLYMWVHAMLFPIGLIK